MVPSSDQPASIWDVLQTVHDPEIPTLSVVELGMISGIEESDQAIRVGFLPTFAGCPALHFIQFRIQKALHDAWPHKSVEVYPDRAVAWNSDQISEIGLMKLKAFGLAPPSRHGGDFNVEDITKAQCPWCDSNDTVMNSPFGGTLCRAVHHCNTCGQLFEQFKPL